MTRTATCRECGQTFECQRATALYCSAKCRQTFNNRRAMRGAELYDLFMSMRYERERAAQQGVWKFMCRMAKSYRANDERERDGRKSWDDMRDVFERNVFLNADIIVTHNAGKRKS
jgi:hypothetical protein